MIPSLFRNSQRTARQTTQRRKSDALRLELLEPRRVLTAIAYTEVTLFDGGLEESQQVELIDIDSDGDLDAIALSGNGAVTYLNDGSAQFSAATPLDTRLESQTRSMAFADFDGDDDVDLVIGSRGGSNDAVITLLLNQGDGSFDHAGILGLGSDDTFIDDLEASDIDEDGDIDIIAVGRNSGRILKLINIRNSGRFSAPIDAVDQVLGIRAVHVADIDGDNDNDLVAVSSYRSTFDDELTKHQFMWFENQDGSFSQKHEPIDIGVGGRFLDVADFDSDGDFDVVVPEQTAGRVVLFENTDGQGTFQESQVLSNDLEGAERTLAIDLDADGDRDVAVTADAGGKVVWFENTDGQFGPEQTINDTIQQASGLAAGDLNGDNELDLLTTSQFAGIVQMHLAQPETTFATSIISEPNTLTPTHTETVDIDGDGLLDVVAIAETDAELSWYKNLGDLNFGQQNIIAKFDTPPSFFLWDDLAVADIDGDGDVDIVTTEPNLNQIQWYSNDGSGNFAAQPAIGEDRGALEIVVADFENDGDQDFLVVEFNFDAVTWYVNENGIFDPIFVAREPEINRAQIATGDIDLDGDLDVVIANNADPPASTSWYINVEGQQFRTALTIESDRTAIDDVSLVDVDGDGNLDAVVASYAGFNDTQIRWYRNQGDGAFAFEPQDIGEQFIVSELEFGDLDNDGDLDVFAPARDTNVIEWFDQQADGSFVARLVDDNIELLGRQASIGDLNNDGFPDLITAHGQANAIVAYVANNPYDLDGNGIVEEQDIHSFCQAMTQADLAGDLNGDAQVDLTDLEVLLHGGFRTVVGDANLDGIFNSADLVGVFQANEFEDNLSQNSSWQTGDWNCDSEFTTTDLVFVFQRNTFTNRAIAAAVHADFAEVHTNDQHHIKFQNRYTTAKHRLPKNAQPTTM